MTSLERYSITLRWIKEIFLFLNIPFIYKSGYEAGIREPEANA